MLLYQQQCCKKSTVHYINTKVNLHYKQYAGGSDRAVMCMTVVWEDQGSNPTMGSCVFIVNITTIYRFGHELHTLTAVPRSTQPSTLRGTVKWVSAFGLSNNNKWRWWVWLLAAYRWTHSPGRLAWAEGQRPLGAVPNSWTRWTLEVACHNDSTINIIILIMYYYYYCCFFPLGSKDPKG